MKKLIKITTTFVCALTAALAIGISANAAIFEQYGYSLPLETLANNPGSLNSQNYISLPGDTSYDDVNGFCFTPTSSSNAVFTMGGTGYSGETLNTAVSNGKIKTVLTYSLKPSDNPNQNSNPVEYLDFRQFVKYNDAYTTVGFKHHYKTDSQYQVNFDNGLGAPIQTVSLNYDKFYTYICEIDVINNTIYQCFKDYENGNIISDRTLTGYDITAVRNGARFRSFSMWDLKMKEFSCYRETFITKNEQITDVGTEIKAQFEVAIDCSENSAYGELNKTSPVLVLCQYDRNNRLISFDVKSADLTAKSVSADTLSYTMVTASVEKSRYYHHAAAYIWNNEDDMYAYREPLTIN